jgi:hypothetical protein
MKLAFVVAFAALTSACAVEPPGAGVLAVADPSTPVQPVRYQSVTSGTVNYQPVQPRPWGEVNEQVAPEAENE